jgi:hypothetical protein
MNNTQAASVEQSTPISSTKPPRSQPIPPPSEPRQYRAIGLVHGRYVPSEEQHTKGMVVTDDGSEIDAVLLGRVISLIKNHLDLEKPHLWVVYPRTRQQEEELHVQIAGVWDPKKLHPNPESLELPDPEDTEPSEDPQIKRPLRPVEVSTPSEPRCEDGYFSVRGEAVFCSAEQELVIIKIQQTSRNPEEKRKKSFKLHLKGVLPEERPLRHFWDVHLMRDGQHLTIQEANDMGFMPKPKPRKKFDKKRGGGFQKRYSSRPSKAVKPGDEGPSRVSKPIPKKRNPSPDSAE